MKLKRCSRNDQHSSHEFQIGNGDDAQHFKCPGYLAIEEPNMSTRLQRLFDEQTLGVKQLTSEALGVNLAKGDREDVRIRVELAKANATSALALAIFLTGGDLELALSRIASAVEQGVSVTHE